MPIEVGVHPHKALRAQFATTLKKRIGLIFSDVTL